MKDGAVIKVMWLVMGGAVKASLPVLGISDPETFWKEAKTPRTRLHGSSRFRSRMKIDIQPFSPDAAYMII